MIDKRLLASRIAYSGISQRALAKKIGITANTLSSKVNGHSEFTSSEIERVCNELHIEPNDAICIFLPSLYRKRYKEAERRDA
jgi:transcriptional regulator with XRE-family HTH domain